MRDALKFGAWTGLAISVYLALVIGFGWYHDTLLNLDLPMMLVGIVWAHRLVRRDEAVPFGYLRAVGLGLTVAAVSGLVSRMFYFLWLRFVDDAILQMIVDQWKAAGREVEKGTPFSFASGNLIGWVVVGLLASLIISIFTRRSRLRAQPSTP